jgi:hypothetical protein
MGAGQSNYGQVCGGAVMTAANPTAIDLEAIKERVASMPLAPLHDQAAKLVTAVEALRERVAELEGDNETAIKWQQFYMKRAEAAAAINKELVVALEQIAQIQRDKCENASAEMLFMLLDNKVGIASTALAKARGES